MSCVTYMPQQTHSAMELDDWQRIEKTVRWTGLTVNSFALNIGLNRSENLYRIKRGENGVSKELAEMITARYPELSRAWLLTGEGNMFIDGEGTRNPIPAYDMDAALLAGLDHLPAAAYAMSLPRAGHVTFAALMLNRSMEPDIPTGSTLLLKECSLDEIIPGYPYLVASDSITAVRTVRLSDDGERLHLIASNHQYGEITVERCRIVRLYAVKGHIHYNM